MIPRGKRSAKSEEVDLGQVQSDDGESIMTMQRPTFKWEWNINTLAVVFVFITSFVTWGYTISTFSERQQRNTEDIIAIRQDNSSQNTRLSNIELILAKAEQTEFKINLLEKGQDSLDTRIGRVSESYANQFADFRTQLSAISTQIALVQQSQARLENIRLPPSIVQPLPQSTTPGTR